MTRIRSVRECGTGPVPSAVVQARNTILEAHGGGGPCTRCDGEGYLEDNETWIVAKGKKGPGKVCFRCQGDGIEPCNLPDPLVVRANVIKKLAPLVKAGDVRTLTKLARQFRSGPFWPVLTDAFGRAQAAAGRVYTSYLDEVTRPVPVCRQHNLRYDDRCRFCRETHDAVGVPPPSYATLGYDEDDDQPRDWGDL